MSSQPEPTAPALANVNLSTLLEEVASKGKSLVDGDPEVRKELLATTRSLFLALETPIEAILRMEWAEPTLHVANRIAVELRLFEKLAINGGSARSSAQLATMTGADPVLMGRILRHLAAMGVVQEAGADRYSPTDLSNALIQPHYRDGIPNCFDTAGPPLLNLPQYLANTGYKNPSNPSDGAFQLGHRTTLPLFGWMAEHPKNTGYFRNFMKGYAIGRPQWTDFFPVQEVLGKGASEESDTVLFVDIGGNTGRDVVALKQEFPQLLGRIINQDLPSVIQEITGKLPEGIEAMAYDFFTPQPVKGARAYYIHSVLHDWPDDKCRDILTNTAAAMTKGYSKLLINDNVIPGKGAHYNSTGMDLFMMAVFSAMERTEPSWEALLAAVGLKIVKIWTYEQGLESLIEAELA